MRKKQVLQLLTMLTATAAVCAGLFLRHQPMEVAAVRVEKGNIWPHGRCRRDGLLHAGNARHGNGQRHGGRAVCNRGGARDAGAGAGADQRWYGAGTGGAGADDSFGLPTDAVP